MYGMAMYISIDINSSQIDDCFLGYSEKYNSLVKTTFLGNFWKSLS